MLEQFRDFVFVRVKDRGNSSNVCCKLGFKLSSGLAVTGSDWADLPFITFLIRIWRRFIFFHHSIGWNKSVYMRFTLIWLKEGFSIRRTYGDRITKQRPPHEPTEESAVFLWTEMKPFRSLCKILLTMNGEVEIADVRFFRPPVSLYT